MTDLQKLEIMEKGILGNDILYLLNLLEYTLMKMENYKVYINTTLELSYILSERMELCDDYNIGTSDVYAIYTSRLTGNKYNVYLILGTIDLNVLSITSETETGRSSTVSLI